VPDIQLSERDRADLKGDNGAGACWAMTMLFDVARAFGATQLIDIESAHLVGAYHSGPANLNLLDRLFETGARVRVPATLSASSADLTETAPACYRVGDLTAARAVVERGIALGCTPALTCAPYFLSAQPRFGQRLAWAESNAAIFANSVIGARTLKTPQYLDLACALAGRAPLTGPLTDEGRAPTVRIDISGLSPPWFETSLGAELLGYAVGALVGSEIAFVEGLSTRLDVLSLRSVCSGLGVTGSAPMVHIDEMTPEAHHWSGCAAKRPALALGNDAMNAALKTFECPRGDAVGAVFLGAPHFGLEDLKRLVAILDRPLIVPIYVSISRAAAIEVELLDGLSNAGVTLVRDTCTYYGPPAAQLDGVAVTSSIKWAVYATNRAIPVHLTSLNGALNAAQTGVVPPSLRLSQ